MKNAVFYLFYFFKKCLKIGFQEVFKIVRRDVIEDLFKTPNEIQDFLGQWVKCFTCFPPKVEKLKKNYKFCNFFNFFKNFIFFKLAKHLSLFELKYVKNPKLKEEQGLFRKKLENNYIE